MSRSRRLLIRGGEEPHVGKLREHCARVALGPGQRGGEVYALNCLLHVPKADLPAVLNRIASLLHSGGLFFYDVYGGSDWEGMVDADGPPRQRFCATRSASPSSR